MRILFTAAIVIACLVFLSLVGGRGQAQSAIAELCPSPALLLRSPQFAPDGLLLTTFDPTALWVYDIGKGTRYPLPETRPCTSNCRLAPNADWLTYLDPTTMVYTQMRPDGTQRTPILGGIADLQWWSSDTWLAWTPDHTAFLLKMGDSSGQSRQDLDVAGAISVQPNGTWGVVLQRQADGSIARVLLDLATRQQADAMRARLALDAPYFSALAWSPDGTRLAYVGRGATDPTLGIAGAELFLAQPNNPIPQQLTYFALSDGAVRVDGYAPNALAWSPDGTRLAFWVIPLTSADPATTTGEARIHILDVNSGALTRYCGFSTTEHTPNPPRLVWSPDGSHLAFGGNVTGDNKSYLLLALDVATGQFTELSEGLYAALGQPDVIGWGRRP